MTIHTVVVKDTAELVIEQVIDRDTYTVALTTPDGSITLQPDDARLLAVDLLSRAMEPDVCTGGRDEGGCSNYVPCDLHGAP